ncbi:3-ketodihydrosphingosine reductase tsc-10 [Bombardia bombarda]|uniref:3-dehydrosphinganine reductase n=1 Tax=Bombardia bombarda TaxID=252184 RepID=A0AA39XBA7_9PEZI|nr:3-ketodihydrosphingosine reductase tsc-10 [Bombardia bombarda]
MEYVQLLLQQLSTSSSSWTAILLATGILGISLAAIMGLFFGKNTSQFPVEGRTILLTGASEGMGRSAAVQLSAKGAHVILVARNVGRLEEALAEVKSAAKSPTTQRFTYISADVAEHDYAARVVAEAMAWNGGAAPDIVWCVAGMSTPMLWADSNSDSNSDSMVAARRNMDVNYFGAADMSRAILREWLAPENSTSPTSQPKHIIFTASVLALFAIVGYGPYTPSKWALRGLADTLAMELNLYPNNPVKIHVVYPATIVSPGLERENKTKPDITVEMEKDEPPETPETVARRAIAGLEAGNYFVTVSFLGRLMQCGIMGGSPRNNWVFDTVLGWFIPIIYFFVLGGMNAQVKAWAKKHGHPSTYPQKS